MAEAQQTVDENLDDIVAINDYVKRFPSKPWPTEAAARWAVNQRHKNGLAESGALLKLNNRLYIYKPAMLDWLVSSVHK